MARSGRDFYSILGVSRDADDAALRKAYKKLAVKWHPDKNLKNKAKAEEKFKDIAEAYAILSDPKKRQVFDVYGEEGLKAGVDPDQARNAQYSSAGFGGPGSGFTFTTNGSGFENIDPNEIFAQFFGANTSQSSTGGSSTNGNPFVFSSSNGRGNKFNTGSSSQVPSGFASMFGNSMNMQDPMDVEQQSRKRKLEKPKPCMKDVYCTLEENYNGVTKKIKVTRKEVSSNSNGQISTGTNILQIPIKAGMKVGTKFTFHGEGDQSLNQETQDIIFTLKNKPHNTFKRDGDDLSTTVDLTLEQAVKGARVQVPTIQGKQLNILTQPLSETKQTMTMIGQGFINSKTKSRGNLIIQFNVKLPTKI